MGGYRPRRGRGSRRGGRGSQREPKKEVTAAELDAEMDNYHKFDGKLDELESAKASGQPVPVNVAKEAAEEATEEATEEAAEEETKVTEEEEAKEEEAKEE